jgi:hypothetical protein
VHLCGRARGVAGVGVVYQISIIIIFASFVDKVLFKILKVVMSTVEVAFSPSYSSLSPPIVSLTRCFSALFGL